MEGASISFENRMNDCNAHDNLFICCFSTAVTVNSANTFNENARLLVSVSLWRRIDAVFTLIHSLSHLVACQRIAWSTQTRFPSKWKETFEIYLYWWHCIKCAEKKTEHNKRTNQLTYIMTATATSTATNLEKIISTYKWIDEWQQCNKECSSSGQPCSVSVGLTFLFFYCDNFYLLKRVLDLMCKMWW